MLNFRHVLFTGVIFCASLSNSQANGRVIPFQHWQTQNGMQVYFNHVSELPIVDIKVGFYAGSAFDTKQPGLASLTSSLFFEGTGTLSADDIAKQLDSLGTVYAASADRDYAYIGLRSLTDDAKLTPAFNLLTQVLAHPVYSESSFSRKKSETLASLAHQQESPDAIAENQFYATVFAGTPYANPVNGYPADVAKISKDDCMAFFKSHYTAKNGVIAIVGDVDEAKAKALSEKISRELATGERKELSHLDPATTKNATLFIQHPAIQSTVRIGELGISRKNPDLFTLKVGNYTLGGGSMTSRLTNEVREKRGLSYSVYSYFAPLQNKGPFLIGLQTQGSQTTQAIDVTRKTLLDYLNNGPSDIELNQAKQFLTGSFPLFFSNNNDIATQILGLGLQELPEDYFDTYIDKVNAVTKDDIKNAFARTISPEKLITVVVGNQPPKTESAKADKPAATLAKQNE